MIKAALANAFGVIMKRQELTASGEAVNEQHDFVPSLQKMGQAACIAAMIVVGIVLIGTLLKIQMLVAGVAGMTAMNAVTAVALGVAAVSLWLNKSEEGTKRNKLIGKAGAIFVIGLGLARLAGIVLPMFGVNVNALMMFQGGGDRAAITGTVNFLLLGFGILSLDSESQRVQKYSQLGTFVAATISITTLLGYAFHVEGFYQKTGMEMALQTAVTCALVCVGILFLRPNRGPMALLCSQTTGGVMARRLLPACFTVPAVLGLLGVTGERLGFYSNSVGAVGVVMVLTILLLALVWRSALMLVRMDDERKMAEEALKKAKAAAEGANALKSAFFANISHEIRTPLTAIIGFTDLFFTPTRSDQEKVDCVDRIRRNGEHLLTIINDILDLSKIEAGKIRVETMVCSPFEIVAGVASMLRAKALNKNLKLDVVYESLIPQTIRTDPTRMRQAMINLVANAIKFSETGGVKIVVSMAVPATAPKPMIQIKVIDSGIGIDPEHAKNLFQPFVQADASMSRRFGGTGLGLSITKHLAKLLGGDVSFTSESGKGSTFTLTLETGPLAGVPMFNDPKEVTWKSNESLNSEDMRSIKLSGRILLAEDGVENQALIEAYLKEAGATVDIVGNGQLAVEKAMAAWERKKPYDLVLMDIQMPVLDGWRATMRLREKGYRPPIIALTANAMPADRDRCLNVGCTDFVSKPIDPSNLLKVVSRYLKLADGSEPVPANSLAA